MTADSDVGKLKRQLKRIFIGTMSASLEVIIQYNGLKHQKLVRGAIKKPVAVQLLLWDLAALRADHCQPSQKNIKRVRGKFYLSWESAGGCKDGVRIRSLLLTI